jgi:hypothetical protein
VCTSSLAPCDRAKFLAAKAYELKGHHTRTRSHSQTPTVQAIGAGGARDSCLASPRLFVSVSTLESADLKTTNLAGLPLTG